MTELIERLTPLINSTIERLNNKKFAPDPIAGKHFSRIVSVMSSAYKRHGFILERAILEQLKNCPDFEVWDDHEFQVTNTADHIVDTAIKAPDTILGTETGYMPGHRTLQVDAIVYDRRTNIVRAYEIKRGSGLHDSGKRRSILRDLLCVQVLLKSYARERGLSPVEAHSHIIFYYGKCSIPKPFSLTRDELDGHYGWPVKGPVEEINELFRQKLFSILASA
ncbi:MAG: hypothetical protein KDA48_11665 [Amphiplicatus sp.]|nr:hypothetical protein [Amphiplicatus sp.]